MLRVRTTDGPEGVALEGDGAGMEVVHAVAMGGAGRVELHTGGDPSPYARFLRWLVVEEVAGPTVEVVQEVGGNELIVRCSADRRALVASNLALRDAPSGYHAHYEHHPDHHHLSSEAVPIVVTRL